MEELETAMRNAWQIAEIPLNLKILKWFELNKFIIEPKRSACASITDTHHHERTHKDLKKASNFTNNNPDKLVQQTLAKSHINAQSNDVVLRSKKDASKKRTAVRDCLFEESMF